MTYTGFNFSAQLVITIVRAFLEWTSLNANIISLRLSSSRIIRIKALDLNLVESINANGPCLFLLDNIFFKNDVYIMNKYYLSSPALNPSACLYVSSLILRAASFAIEAQGPLPKIKTDVWSKMLLQTFSTSYLQSDINYLINVGRISSC